MPALRPDPDASLGLALKARGRSAAALRTLLRRAGGASGVLALSAAEAAALAEAPEDVVAPLLAPPPPAEVAAQRRRLASAGARLVLLTDPEYPPLLAEIADPPVALFVRGQALGHGPAVGVVGARRATRAGLEAARHLASGLARAGVTVVSGFARGVDAAAHGAALEAGGDTWAVLGCGVDVCYPPEQTRLLEALLRQGTLVSEFPMGTAPEPWRFPVRNRVIAGLCHLVVVVEAAERSGSLITARCAAEAGRDVAAVPGSPLSPLSAGTNALLKDGAILVRGAADVLAELPQAALRALADGAPPRDEPAPGAALPPDPAALLSALDPLEPRDADALAAATGLTAARLSAALVTLELEGLLDVLPGAVFARKRRGA